VSGPLNKKIEERKKDPDTAWLQQKNKEKSRKEGGMSSGFHKHPHWMQKGLKGVS